MTEEPFRLAIPADLEPTLSRMRGQAGEWDAIVLGGVTLTMGMLAGVLAPDGQVFARDAFTGGPWYAAGEREAYFLVACGADDQAAPELLRLLPARSRMAAYCTACEGRGRERGSGWPCYECGSLGWVRVHA